MNNKFLRGNTYHSRRKSNITPFSLHLSESHEIDSTLFYSRTVSKLIELDKVEKPHLSVPETAPFDPEDDMKKQCGRKDCFDRKF